MGSQKASQDGHLSIEITPEEPSTERLVANDSPEAQELEVGVSRQLQLWVGLDPTLSFKAPGQLTLAPKPSGIEHLKVVGVDLGGVAARECVTAQHHGERAAVRQREHLIDHLLER